MIKEKDFERVVETLDDGTEVSTIHMKGDKKTDSKSKEKSDDDKSSS